MTIFYGDPLLKFQNGEMDINIVSGQPESDTGLSNPVSLSLFPLGSWMDKIDSNSFPKTGDGLNNYQNSNIDTALILALKDAIKNSLEWMNTEKMIQDAKTAIKILNFNQIGIEITLQEIQGNLQNSKFVLNWEQMRGGV